MNSVEANGVTCAQNLLHRFHAPNSKITFVTATISC
jgi:hypothetical protein